MLLDKAAATLDDDGMHNANVADHESTYADDATPRADDEHFQSEEPVEIVDDATSMDEWEDDGVAELFFDDDGASEIDDIFDEDPIRTSQHKTPAWQVLERRREEMALKRALRDDLFDF